MHVKIRKRIGNPTLYNAKINYSPQIIILQIKRMNMFMMISLMFLLALIHLSLSW